ncbi:hypothetical protein T11_4949 [Trichinella zimbabwensis]|uniref:Uncharacterized protein n=1 Tax=Trichinella zimbabwensis TaxID=268475 RepID=A0A0V1H5T6_9BILA|nr:hypothetical protein T11_4949 [Trichinella zimbabwensis]
MLMRWVSCSLLLLHFNKNAVNVMQKIHIKPRPSVRKFHGFTFASYLIANMPAVRDSSCYHSEWVVGWGDGRVHRTEWVVGGGGGRVYELNGVGVGVESQHKFFSIIKSIQQLWILHLQECNVMQSMPNTIEMFISNLSSKSFKNFKLNEPNVLNYFHFKKAGIELLWELIKVVKKKQQICKSSYLTAGMLAMRLWVSYSCKSTNGTFSHENLHANETTSSTDKRTLTT